MCDDVALILRGDDFYDDAHRKLYQYMLDMHSGGQRIDTTLLVERLQSCGDLELIGGMAYLAEIAQAVPNAAHAVYYAEIVRDKSTLRPLILCEHRDPPRRLRRLDRAARDAQPGRGEDLRDPRQARRRRRGHRSPRSCTRPWCGIDARMKHEHAAGGIETGFTDLDALTGGLHDSELVILAARPSMGKTALAMNIAEYVAMQLSITTLFVSLEMSSLELADRLLCSAARVNGHRLRNGTISNDDRRKLVEKAAEISQSPLFVDDTPSRTMTEIAAAARRLKRRNKLGLVVIDYLQLIEPDNPKDPRQEQVAKIARRLKGLARELKVPVLCLAQLNRQAEVSRESKPRLSHLRESGAIEQDADVVMFVHREEYYCTNEEDRARVAGQAEDHRRQAAQRPHRRRQAALAARLHALRKRRLQAVRRVRAVQRWVLKVSQW